MSTDEPKNIEELIKHVKRGGLYSVSWVTAYELLLTASTEDIVRFMPHCPYEVLTNFAQNELQRRSSKILIDLTKTTKGLTRQLIYWTIVVAVLTFVLVLKDIGIFTKINHELNKGTNQSYSLENKQTGKENNKTINIEKPISNNTKNGIAKNNK